MTKREKNLLTEYCKIDSIFQYLLKDEFGIKIE